MPLPPITAQIITDLPPGLKDLGEVVIIAAALLGVVYAIRPLISAFVGSYKELASVNRELLKRLEASDGVIDRNTAQAERTTAQIGAFETSITKLAEAQATLVKALPDTIAQFVKATESAADRTIKTVTDASVAHDAFAREGIARLEAQGARLIEMVESGQKVSRAELAQLSRDILAAIHSLTPPQPPPVALRVEPNPAKEGNAA